jgi:hypothetical protein
VKLETWACTDSQIQQNWVPQTQAGPIRLAGEQFCIDLTGGSSANGNDLQIWDCTEGPNQQWVFVGA